MTKKIADKQQPDGCPRRAETGSTAYLPGTWYMRGGLPRCSYCGSLHPDAFMTAAREGTSELGPTDKNYKVYIDAGGGHGKFYFQHLSAEQQQEFVDLYNARPRRTYSDTGMTFAVTGASTGMAVGYPGHFYVLPFFMARGGNRG